MAVASTPAVAEIFARNNALRFHPGAGDERLTERSSNWLWAVTAVFLLTFLVFFAFSSILATGRRAFFHYIFTIILLVSAITYFAEASNLGWRLVRQVNHDAGDLRQVFWPKYIRWAVAFAGLILVQSSDRAVGLGAWPVVLYEISLAWIWVACYLVAGYVESNYKWGLYAFGTFAALILIVGGGRQAATTEVRDHKFSNAWITLLWLMYPIAWGLSTGGNRIGVGGGYVWYGILDMLLICGVAFMYMFRRRGTPNDKTHGTV